MPRKPLRQVRYRCCSPAHSSATAERRGGVQFRSVRSGRTLERSATSGPHRRQSRDNEIRRPPGARSRPPKKEGVRWRPSPSAAPVPITHALTRATTMNTTRHTTCRPGRCARCPGHIESMPRRRYTSARAGTSATTKPTISVHGDLAKRDRASFGSHQLSRWRSNHTGQIRRVGYIRVAPVPPRDQGHSACVGDLLAEARRGRDVRSLAGERSSARRHAGLAHSAVGIDQPTRVRDVVVVRVAANIGETANCGHVVVV
jgi:hypothetical protein